MANENSVDFDEMMESFGSQGQTNSKVVSKEDVVSSSLPSFPIQVFPKKIQEVINNFIIQNGSNPDYLCGSMFTIFASAMGNLWEAKFSSQIVTPIIYMVLIGPPSSGKTPPLRLAEMPLQKYDLENDVEYNKIREEYDHLMQMSIKERREQGLPEFPEKPAHKEILAIDTTIEKLFEIIRDNPHGIVMFVNELNKLISNLDRYGKGSDEAYWIDLYDGHQVKYERKGCGEYINVYRPYVSVIGGTQPGLLSKMFAGERASSGFSSRFLKVFPDITHMPKWNRGQTDEKANIEWDLIIRQVLNTPYLYDSNGEITAERLEFTNKAQLALYNWEDRIESEWEDADCYMQGVCGKLKTYILRFALIIHIMRYICGETTQKAIDEISASSACLLANYFLAMDKRVQLLANRVPADTIQQKLFDSLPDTFTTAEALSLGNEMGIPERTIKRFLKDGLGHFFAKEKHGIYNKLYR